MPDKKLTAFALNCSLKKSHASEKSSTDRLLSDLISALGEHEVTARRPLRIVDKDIKPGVLSDEGEGDDWPKSVKR